MSPNKKFYNYNQMERAVRLMKSELEADISARSLDKNDCVILGLARGGLPLAVHLSNVSDLPFESLHYSSPHGYGTDAYKKELEAEHYASLKGKQVYVIDDLIDSGHTLKDVTVFLAESVNVAGYRTFVWLDKQVSGDVMEVDFAVENAGNGHWVVFPWEQI